MISASAADAHRFGRVKRNGYDPAEVDAVVARLVEALRSYERSNARLEERLAEADVSADAIRRTFIAAEQTRDEILEAAREQARRTTSEAETEASTVVADAQARAAEATERGEREVAALAGLANRLDLEIARRREALLRDAEAQASALIADAEYEASQLTIASVEQARSEAESAVAAIEEQRRRAELAIRTTSMAAAWTRREAELAARSIVADAEDQAERVVADAARERWALSERIAELRAALAVLETGAAQVAALTAHHSGVLDLTTIERIESLNLDFAAVESSVAEHQGIVGDAALDGDQDTSTVDTILQDDPVSGYETVAIDDEAIADVHIHDEEDIDESPDAEAAHAFAPTLAPVIDGGTLTEPARLVVAGTVPEHSVAEAAVEPEATADDATEERDESPQTYYQRSTGIPLSERVKLARRSG